MFKDIPVSQCFYLPGLREVIFRKVATALGNKLWDEKEQKSYNAKVIKSSALDIAVGWTYNAQWGESVCLVKDPEARRRNRNATRQARNEVLRNLCGTSARAAREDMGL